MSFFTPFFSMVYTFNFSFSSSSRRMLAALGGWQSNKLCPMIFCPWLLTLADVVFISKMFPSRSHTVMATSFSSSKYLSIVEKEKGFATLQGKIVSRVAKHCHIFILWVICTAMWQARCYTVWCSCCRRGW